MRQMKLMGALILAATFVSCVMTGVAQAEGPFWKVAGKRLASGETATVEIEASKEYVLTSGTIKIKCAKQKAEAAKLIGSSEANSGTSEETVVFDECSVEGDGEGCKVQGGKIKTEPVSNTLAYRNGTETEGESLLVLFRPAKGAVFVKVKFEGALCTFKETAIEGSVAAEALEEQKNAVLVGWTELEGATGYVSFPSETLKAVFTEKGGKREEVKVSLKAFGKSTTLVGRSSVKVGGKAWGVFSNYNKGLQAVEFEPQPEPGKVPIKPMALEVTIKNELVVTTLNILKNTVTTLKMEATTCGATIAAKTSCKDFVTATAAGERGEVTFEVEAFNIVRQFKYKLES